jgi:two-component sensor histidine kinase
MVADLIQLARNVRAPADARRQVDRRCEALGEDTRQRARLLVSELVTNALRHGTGRIELELTITATGLRICVSDEGRVRPRARVPDESGGFGLHLVEDFSDRWGSGAEGGVVWFEVQGVGG